MDNCKKKWTWSIKHIWKSWLKGRCTRTVFTFPIPTYNITKDFSGIMKTLNYYLKWQLNTVCLIFKILLTELDPGMIRSMCCRLQLDLRELLKRGNGLFGSAEPTGSVGVVTIINMARLNTDMLTMKKLWLWKNWTIYLILRKML